MVGQGEADQLRDRRLGLTIPGSEPLSRLPAFVRRAEELGYTDAWSYEITLYDAFTPLAAAAAVTERIRLGAAIVPVFTRPPGVIAMEAASLSDLSSGRFVLGLGSSTKVVVEDWLGVPFQRPLERTKEVLVQVRELLGGGKVGGMRLGRPPAQPPPIWLAALGPRMLELADELADGLCFFMVGARQIPKLVEAGGGKESVCRVLVVPGSGPEAAAKGRRHVVSYALAPYYARSMARQGFGEEVQAIIGRWREGDREGAAGQVSEAMLDELVLTGDAERIAEGVERYRQAGLSVPALLIFAEGEELDRLVAEIAGLQ